MEKSGIVSDQQDQTTFKPIVKSISGSGFVVRDVAAKRPVREEIVNSLIPAASTDKKPTVQNDEDFVKMVTDAFWNMLPDMLWGLPARDEKKIEIFNKALINYCNKKGIDVSEYLFDELGLVLSGIPLVISIKKDLDVKKAKDKKAKAEIIDPLNVDFEHDKEINKEN